MRPELLVRHLMSSLLFTPPDLLNTILNLNGRSICRKTTTTMTSTIASQVTIDDRHKAKVSYYVEVVMFVAYGLFLTAWLHAAHQYESGTGTGIFDKQYLAEGFCNSPTWATQHWCGVFDITMALFLIHLWGKTADFGSIAYLAVHGYAHWSISTGRIDPRENTTGLEKIANLAIIIGMGPLEIYQNMITAGKGHLTSVVLAVAVEIFLVALFVLKIQRGIYALTYINVAISLCGLFSKLLLLGHTTDQHIKARADRAGKFHYQLHAASILLTAIVWIEPTCCSSLFAKVGGHFWFDVILFLNMFVAMLNMRAKAKSGHHKKLE